MTKSPSAKRGDCFVLAMGYHWHILPLEEKGATIGPGFRSAINVKERGPPDTLVSPPDRISVSTGVLGTSELRICRVQSAQRMDRAARTPGLSVEGSFLPFSGLSRM